MKRSITLLVGCAAMLAACSEDSEIPGPKFKYKEYLIDAYITPEKLNVQDARQELWLTMTGPEYTFWSSGTAYQEFLRLADLHGGRIDRKIEIDPELYYSYGKGGFACYTENFSAINLTADVAVDDEHPAGSSLNDLCFLAYYTYAPFIRNGNTGPEIFDRWTRMDQIAPGDMTMVAYCWMRIWLQIDFNPGTTLTVTLTTDTGRILTAQCVREPTT